MIGNGSSSPNLSLPKNILNLSKHELKPTEISILDKGLKFVPTPKVNSKTGILRAASEFSRKLKLNYYFKSLDITLPRKPNFIPKSTWSPPEDKIHPEVTDIIKRLNHDISKLNFPTTSKNLTQDEYTAIKTLKQNSDIVIKPADKGSCVVVMDKSDYIKEGYRHLNNTKHYKKLDEPIFPKTAESIENILSDMQKEGHLLPKQFDFLKPPKNIKQRQLYFLPKIHKPKEKWTDNGKIPPGRPIVSDCGSESYEVAKYIDSYLKPLVNQHDTYLKNTTDFLNQLSAIKVQPGSRLITLDVESMFTNIDADMGLKAIKKAFENNPIASRPDKHILSLLEICLKNNDFEFNNENFLQISGTSMGKPFGPNFCDVTMAEFEREVLPRCNYKPTFMKRYLDDIFIIWDHDMDKFWEFFDILNNHHPSIKFTATVSDQSVDFLDVTVFKGPKLVSEQKLDTKVFFKPTDTHQLLHKSSYHPKHTFAGIIQSQILRFKSICSQKSDFETACSILFKSLKTRNYSSRFLRSIKQKTIQSLKQSENQTFGCQVSDDGACKPCDKPRCHTCPFVTSDDCYRSFTTGQLYPINLPVDCSSKNVIYLIQCTDCGIQYVGETKNTLRTRARKHRSDILNHKDTTVASHFNNSDNLCAFDQFRIIPILQCPTLDTEEETDLNRKQIEAFVIKSLKTYMPYGLNKKASGVKDIPIIPFVAPYCKLSQNAAKLAHIYYDHLQDKFPITFTSRFVAAYSANKNIKNHLVSNKVK